LNKTTPFVSIFAKRLFNSIEINHCSQFWQALFYYSKTIGMNIWLVDDNAFYIEVLKKLLENCTVHSVTEKMNSGEELINAVLSPSKKKHPDLILLDLYMDKTSGWEVLDTFKNNNIKIPIIVVTYSDFKQDITKSASYEIVKGYFQKGDYPAVLFEMIKNIEQVNN
jgi:CheY-like chemotaxis protein